MTKNTDPMAFSLDRIEVPLKLTYDGETWDYILLEADGSTGTAYRNAVVEGMTLGENGKPTSINGVGSLPVMLVSKCLRLLKKDAQGNSTGERLPVAENKVAQFPERVVKALFERAKEISELGEEDDTLKKLRDVLSTEGAPCSYNDLIEHCKELEQKELVDWLTIEDEDSAGNVL